MPDHSSLRKPRTVALLARGSGVCLAMFLPALLVGCDASGFQYKHSSGNGRSTTIRGTGDEQSVEVRLENPAGTIVEFKSQGQVVLKDKDSDVESISPSGYLRIREKTRDSDRDFEVHFKGTDETSHTYRVDGAEADFDKKAALWFTTMLGKMVHESPIGADARARRIANAGGVSELLTEIKNLKDPHAQEIYFRVLSSQKDLSADDTSQAVGIASGTVVSPSALEDILGDLARHHPKNEELSLAMIQAASKISSPNAHEDTLRKLASKRAMTTNVSVAAIQSAGKISSPSAKSDAIIAILKASPSESQIQKSYITVVSKISSPSQQEDAMIELLKSDISDHEVFHEVASVTATISSPSKQEDVMRKLIRVAPNDEAVLRACLDVVPRISSSSKQEDVVEEFLRRRNLSPAVLEHARGVIKHISSRSKREDLEEKIAKRLAR